MNERDPLQPDAGRGGMLPRFAVRRPVTTAMIFVAIVTMGAVGFTRLAVDLLPSVDMPRLTIVTGYDGVGAEEIETLITRPIEEALATIQNVERIEGVSMEGTSRVVLQFSWDTDLDSALGDVRANLERVRHRLPDDASQPIAYKFDLGAMPVMFLSLSSEGMDPRQLRMLADDRLKVALERVEGVARVDVRGGLQRQIHVDLISERLAAYGVSPQTVVSALRRENQDVPGGSVHDGDRELILKTSGELRSLEQLSSVIVTYRPEGPVRLSDLASVRDAAEERRNVVWIDQAEGIRLSVSKLDGANTVDVARRLRSEVERLDKSMDDVSLRILVDTAEFIEASVTSVQQAAAVGGVLAVIILLLFLRDIRATLIIAAAIPISVIGTFALMDIAGVTLNVISFGGLALGIGMLVDSAIVILENIVRHRDDLARRVDEDSRDEPWGSSAGGAERSLDPREAAVEGSREVASAVTASTFTTLTVFVPVVFLGGFVAIFFGQLAMVVVFSLACALLVALTLVPMLASRLPPRKPGSTLGSGPIMLRIERLYRRFIAWLLRRKWVALLVALFMLGGAFGMVAFGLVATELAPDTDEGDVRVNVELPPGTRLEVTEVVMRGIEARVRAAVPEAEAIFTTIGPRGGWAAGSNVASLRVRMVDQSERSRSSAQVAAELRPLLAGYPDARVRVRPGGGLWIFRVLRGGGDRLQVDITGYDLETGADLARQVADIMRGLEEVADARVSREYGASELGMNVDWERAAAMGLSPSAVGDAVRSYVLGSVATHLREGGDEYRVIVRLAEDDRRHIEQVMDLPLFPPGGGQVPIRSVASVTEQPGTVAIQRRAQERIIYVTGTLADPDTDLGSVAREVERRIRSEVVVPEGFHLSMGGERREQDETFGGLMLGLILAMALVYMVMAAQFESLVQPFIIMFAVPLASLGVVLSLVITGTSFNMYSFLGAIVLVGIVVNNAIVLVDYTNMLRREKGYGVVDAVLEGTRRRLRPIIMTTATTSLALVPVAMGIGEGGDLNAPLARVVVGGLLSASLVTLVVIPAAYAFIEERRERRALRRAARGQARSQA